MSKFFVVHRSSQICLLYMPWSILVIAHHFMQCVWNILNLYPIFFWLSQPKLLRWFHGCWKGRQGRPQPSPGFWNFRSVKPLAKKILYSWFLGGKMRCHHFSTLSLRKIFLATPAKIHYCSPSGKTPSDAHRCPYISSLLTC